MFWIDLKRYKPGTTEEQIMKDFAGNIEFEVERGVYKEPKNFRIVIMKEGWMSLQYLIDD